MICIKKIVLCLVCALLLSTTCACSDENDLKLLDTEGQVIATIDSDRKLKKSDDSAYLEIAVGEAVEILASFLQVESQQAKKELYGGKYTVYTAMDKAMSDALKKTCDERGSEVPIGAAITDLKANLVAAYSTDQGKKGENYAVKSAPPCSSIKPLSVYAPAIDNGTINWASRYEDSEYKYIKNLQGVMTPWPNNAGKYYSKRYVYIHQAVAESLNTVAVKCLADYGINESVKFLEENFAMPLLPEKTVAAAKGQEEILGNIALGFLTNGVSVVDMAGYYQIFANGGSYEAPRAVLKICDAEGEEIYKREYEPKQVIKETTAEIMNHILKGVVEPGATGEKAKNDMFEVAGKTGTDDNGKNNWFVAATPEYSAAFWHGDDSKNNAAEIFSLAMQSAYSTKKHYKKRFNYTSDIKQVVYCTESGKQFKAGCSLIGNGYFAQENLPGLCDRH